MIAHSPHPRRALFLAAFLALSLILALSLNGYALADPVQQETTPDATGESTAEATTDPRPPTIITFASDLPTISTADLADGDTLARLSWFAVGLQENQRLVLDRYDTNTFVSLMNEGETSLPLNGSRVITVVGSNGFAPPTYRLAILDFRNRIIDQQVVTIGVLPPADDEITIDAFAADSESVEIAALENGSARVNVSWAVSNRPLTANLVFEQVVGDASAQGVELPRDVLWVPSQGAGVVAPVPPDASNVVVLRLSVVDVVTGNVYAEQTVTVSVAGLPTAVPPTPTPEVVSIVSFTASPETVAIGDLVQLLWQVTGNVTVQVAVETANTDGPQVFASDLPKNAGLVVPISEETFGGAGTITFTLRLLDPEGEIVDIATILVGVEGGVEGSIDDGATESAEAPAGEATPAAEG